MTTVGSYQLKTHLAKLLDRVANGEVIEVTRHGTVIARIVPSHPVSQYDKQGATKLLKGMQRVKLKGTSISELIDYGRKY